MGSRVFVWEEQLPSAVVDAASWRIAAELVAGVPGARLHEYHDGGGQYDQLAVVTRDERVRLDVNRNGSLHVLAAPTPVPPIPGEQLWPRACRPGQAEQIAHEILAACGLDGSGRNRSGARLGYQVIARILTARALDSTEWDARWLGGEGPLARGALVPHPAELDVRLDDVWVLSADQQAIAWFWEGWAVQPGGERLDLTRERATGRSLGELAAHVTRRRAASTARTLRPELPRTPPERDATAWLEFAGDYNAYQRLAGEPHQLELLLTPAREEYTRTGAVPRWCGTDLLRGWLFLLYRADHFAGGYLFSSGDHPETREFKAVAAAWQQASSR